MVLERIEKHRNTISFIVVLSMLIISSILISVASDEASRNTYVLITLVLAVLLLFEGQLKTIKLLGGFFETHTYDKSPRTMGSKSKYKPTLLHKLTQPQIDPIKRETTT